MTHVPLNVVTTAEAARIIGVTPASVRLYERSGKLAAQRTDSGMRLFQRVDVERFARERQATVEVRGSRW